MAKRTYSVGVVLFEGKSVLLVKHTEKARLPTGAYGFPAGRAEDKETPEDAACRELWEETGLRTSDEHLHRLSERKSTLKMKEKHEDFIFQPFLCTHYTGELRESEKTIPEFINPEYLDNLLLITEDVKTITEEGYGLLQKLRV